MELRYWEQNNYQPITISASDAITKLEDIIRAIVEGEPGELAIVDGQHGDIVQYRFDTTIAEPVELDLGKTLNDFRKRLKSEVKRFLEESLDEMLVELTNKWLGGKHEG